MNHFEQTWPSADGLEIYSQGWEPENQSPRAVVCLVHGLGEHSGRYAHVAERLTGAGFAVISFDLRGHGKSAGKRGHVDSGDEFLAEIDRLIQEAGRRYPEKPRFLYGHSLGGILVLYYSLKRQPDLAGVIATSPGLRTSLEEQTFKVAASRVLGIIAGGLCIPTGLAAEDISHDPEVVRLYKEDPLVHDQASLALAKSLQDVIRWTFEHAHEFRLPLLLVHGTADRIAYARGSTEFASQVSCDCTVKLWEGLYHETHNEPEKEDVMDFIAGWIESKR